MAKPTKKAARKAPTKKRGPVARKAATGSSDSRSASERIDAMLADLDDWRGALIARIRKLIHAIEPDVVEDWKWMGSPVWSHEGMFALATAHKDKVKLTFHHGARLRDPGKLFNAGLGGNKWRAIDFHEGDRLDERKLGALLREAMAYNRSHAVPESRGSRAGDA